jgi:hypothetical protein
MPDSPSLGEQEPRTKFQEPIEEKDFWSLILGNWLFRSGGSALP